MNYLIPTFDCVYFEKKFLNLHSNVKYKIKDLSNLNGVFFSDNAYPIIFDCNNSNILKVKHENDNYFFLFQTKCLSFFTTKIQFKENEIIVSLSNILLLTINGEMVYEENVKDVKYSHYEIFGEFCLIYFEGNRNFLLVLQNNGVMFASYYDECNIYSDQKYFMCKLKDSLNHGYVCQIENKELKTYLVYLDNEELMLKNEFVSFVFLDCLKAKNYKYCNLLLNECLKLEDENKIEEFFPRFDYFYPINENKFILINKNTLSGICEFMVENCSIINIITHPKCS